MIAEIPLSLKEPFSQEPMGKNLTRFAQQISGLPDEVCPMPLLPAAELLCFDECKTGAGSISNWARNGFFRLSSPSVVNRKAVIWHI